MSDRRKFLGRSLAGASTLLLSGCYDLSQKPWFTGLLGKVENLSRVAQHVFAGPHTLAPEYSKADIAPVFRANGTLDPGTTQYKTLEASGFKDWVVPAQNVLKNRSIPFGSGRAATNPDDNMALISEPQRSQPSASA